MQTMRAQTKENVATVEGETQIHHSTHQAAHFFSRRSCLEATRTEGLTEAIIYAILCSSNQTELLNDTILISFTDKNLFAFATMKNLHNNQLYASVTTKTTGRS